MSDDERDGPLDIDEELPEDEDDLENQSLDNEEDTEDDDELDGFSVDDDDSEEEEGLDNDDKSF